MTWRILYVWTWTLLLWYTFLFPKKENLNGNEAVV